MTGDQMKILMLNLPFLLRDLLKLEVNIIYNKLILTMSYTISVPILVSIF
jgi:hypothetical protein